MTKLTVENAPKYGLISPNGKKTAFVLDGFLYISEGGKAQKLLTVNSGGRNPQYPLGWLDENRLIYSFGLDNIQSVKGLINTQTGLFEPLGLDMGQLVRVKPGKAYFVNDSGLVTIDASYPNSPAQMLIPYNEGEGGLGWNCAISADGSKILMIATGGYQNRQANRITVYSLADGKILSEVKIVPYGTYSIVSFSENKALLYSQAAKELLLVNMK